MEVPSRPFTVTTACLTAVAVWSLATVPVTVAQLDLMLLHTNDMHSHFDESSVYHKDCNKIDKYRRQCFGGFARVARFVKDEKIEARNKGMHSLFMVAGDIFQGTTFFTLYAWEPVADFINQLRPDIMTLGNHEFDIGINSLSYYLNATKQIPTVVTNLNTASEPRLRGLLLSSHIFTFNNTKVGVVGYLTTETRKSIHVRSLVISDEIVALKKETKKLRDSGVNIIIGLGHSGIEKDKEIAKEIDDIDLIVGGHGHTFLYSGVPPSIEKPYGTYPYYVKNNKNRSVPILHAYAFTKYVGKVELKFDSKGHLIEIFGSPTIMDYDTIQDSKMMKLFFLWKSRVINKACEKVGRTAVKLINDCWEGECNIGNIIADSFVYYNVMRRSVFYEDLWTDAPIAIINSGCIRSSITGRYHGGYINMKQLMNIAPTAHSLVKITISGASLFEAFEHSVFDFTNENRTVPFLQVSGILVEFDLSQSPGHRVSSMFVRCSQCSIPKYEPLDLIANYTIVIDSYLAEGEGNYTAFTKMVKEFQLLDVNLYNAPAIYFRRISPLTTGLEGRIKFKS